MNGYHYHLKYQGQDSSQNPLSLYDMIHRGDDTFLSPLALEIRKSSSEP